MLYPKGLERLDCIEKLGQNNILKHSNQSKKTEEIKEIQKQAMYKNGLQNAGKTSFSLEPKNLHTLKDGPRYTDADEYEKHEIYRTKFTYETKIKACNKVKKTLTYSEQRRQKKKKKPQQHNSQ